MIVTTGFKTACKEITRLSMPLIGFRIIIYTNIFLAMLLIAALGQRELAASAYIAPIQTTVDVCGWSIIFALSIIVGHVFGQGKIAELGKVVRQGWLLGIILVAPMMIIFWYLGDILLFLKQDKNLIKLVQPYFRILTFGVLPNMSGLCLTQFLMGIGKPKIIILLGLLNVVVLFAVGYPLIFGKFGMPRLGMVGVAYADVISSWLNCLIVYIYVVYHPFYKKFQIFNFSPQGWGKDLHYLWQIFRLGLPMCVQFMLELLAFSFTIIIVGWINQASLAAAQILNQISMVMIMGSFGISHAVSVLVGQALGRSDRAAAKSYSEASFVLGLVFAVIVAIIYIAFPKQLVGFYSLDVTNPANSATVNIAVTLFYIYAISQIFDSLRNILAGALRGYRDSTTPMLISAIAIWAVGIPFGYLLGIKLHYGAPGISFAFLLAWFLGAILLLRRFYRQMALSG